MSDKLGLPLMPWQRQVAMVGGELLEDGRPAFRSVTVTVPRQSGKTLLILCWEVQRCLGWGEPQRVAYSAQTGNDARKKLIEDQAPLLHRHRKALGIHRVRRGMGGEGVDFTNGSIIGLLASSEQAGHGKTIDLGVKDELFADEDDRRDQALIPAMATRSAAQILTSSTAGSGRSTTLWREVEAGREAAAEGRTDGVAYFEWSAPDEADITDPATWWACMPALGFTITEDVVRHAAATMSEPEFRRAWLNQWVNPPGLVTDRVSFLDVDGWAAGLDRHGITSDRVRIACEVEWSGAHTSIVVSDGAAVEVAQRRPGVEWVVGWLAERDGRYGPLLLDPKSPANVLVDGLNRAGVEWEPFDLDDLRMASSQFRQAVAAGGVRHLDDLVLADAVAAAKPRVTGQSWVLDRRGSVDMAPLVAAAVALRAASSVEPDWSPMIAVT